jgi:hypothetical protein
MATMGECGDRGNSVVRPSLWKVEDKNEASSASFQEECNDHPQKPEGWTAGGLVPPLKHLNLVPVCGQTDRSLSGWPPLRA